MSQPPAQVTPFLPAARIPRATRHLQRLGLAALAAFGVLILALWQIPPMLDWSQYKGAIATYASARLGRRVTIGGSVSLSLLPRPLLVANDVSLADRGDGISARLGTMRLEVSPAGLIGGRVVPSSLSLDDSVTTLPWPIPRTAAPRFRPAVAREFSAALEGGTLFIGGVAFRDIAASFHTDPDTGAFGAQGSITAAGLPWRFTARLGAPGADGVSALTLTLDGQAPYGKHSEAGALLGTGGAFTGRILADGTVTGALVLHGLDLSRLGSAPAQPWRVEGEVLGDGLTLTAPSLRVALGRTTGRAAAALRLDAPMSLRLQAAFGRFELGPWAWKLVQASRFMALHLPAELDLSADSVVLRGGVVQAPHLVLSLDRRGGAVKTAAAILPGGMHVQFGGVIRDNGTLVGRLHAQAPDLKRSLAWLDLGAMLPDGVLNRADVTSDVDLSSGSWAMTALSGTVDGSQVSGSLALALSARRVLALNLSLDDLALDNWLTWHVATPGLRGVASPFADMDADLRLHVAHASFMGRDLTHAEIDAAGDRRGLVLRHAAADSSGFHLEGAGAIGTDGAVTGLHADVSAPDAAALPAAFAVPPDGPGAGLWHGPFHFEVNGDGPPQNLATQMRADLGDLRAEAESHIDIDGRALSATVTLRHPGAPLLLSAAGFPGAEAWLDSGSLAVLAHVSARAGHVQVRDFSVSAAALSVTGTLDADLARPVPEVNGRINAATLAIPARPWSAATPLPWAALCGWRGHLSLSAARLLAGLQPRASNVRAELDVGDGVAVLDNIGAEFGSGAFSGRMAADATQTPPVLAGQGSLAHLKLPASPGTRTPPGLYDGTADLSGDVTARGAAPDALLTSAQGDLSGSISGGTIAGIDLPGLTDALRRRGPKLKAQLRAGMSDGESPGLTGSFVGVLANGAVSFPAARLYDEAGSITVPDGSVSLAGVPNMRLAVRPGIADPPTLYAVWRGGVMAVDVSAALGRRGKKQK